MSRPTRSPRRDLTHFLDSDADIEFVFSLFDVDNDGFVLVEEVQARFRALYRCALPHCPRHVATPA